ncbi:MAG: hypothetical protein SVU32_06885 [Candidatus Nanohaloarchaea archaeon]|nr:hypothetical protein [Candidatus Nanohaloarchaea archaeon]
MGVHAPSPPVDAIPSVPPGVPDRRHPLPGRSTRRSTPEQCPVRLVQFRDCHQLLFLQLLPELKEGAQHFGNYAFVFALGGFVTFHIVQKWVYKHSKSPEELVSDFRTIHSVFLFIYYFVIGVVLGYLARQHIVQAILFFVPVLLHTVFSSLSLRELHEDVLDQTWIRIVIAGSILPGIAVPFFISMTPTLFHVLLGIITGMLLYISIHDSMPERSEGSPAIFLAGIVLYGLIVIYIWQLV